MVDTELSINTVNENFAKFNVKNEKQQGRTL